MNDEVPIMLTPGESLISKKTIEKFENLNNLKKLNEDRPATAEDIADVQKQLAQVANDPNLMLVCEFVIDFSKLSPPTIPPPPKNFYKFQPKKLQHVPNVIPKGRWNQYLFGGTNKPTTPAPPAVLKSFEGTVCGRFEVSE